jgi:hypothetical protein
MSAAALSRMPIEEFVSLIQVDFETQKSDVNSVTSRSPNVSVLGSGKQATHSTEVQVLALVLGLLYYKLSI